MEHPAPTSRPLPKIILRPAIAEDLNYLYATWLRGYARSARERREWYDGTHDKIERILLHPDTQVIVTSLESRPTFILGYACVASLTTPAVIHWVQVKKKFQQQGVATRMLESVGITRESEILYTFKTKRAAVLASKFARAEHLQAKDYLE